MPRAPEEGCPDRVRPPIRRPRCRFRSPPGELLPPRPYREDIQNESRSASAPCRGVQALSPDMTTTGSGELNTPEGEYHRCDGPPRDEPPDRRRKGGRPGGGAR